MMRLHGIFRVVFEGRGKCVPPGDALSRKIILLMETARRLSELFSRREWRYLLTRREREPERSVWPDAGQP